jgi:uncharacterized protein
VTGQNIFIMEWYNEPAKWNAEEDNLVMEVSPKSDYWRKTHYGFTADNGPFYYCTVNSDFEVSVKITGDYQSQYDQMGLMLRIDDKHWIKTGIEFVDGVFNFSAVVTNEYSSWNVIPLPNKPVSIWIRAIRKKDAVEIFYSLDSIDFLLSNLAYFPENQPAMVGMMAASPTGEGFNATFEHFSVKK